MLGVRQHAASAVDELSAQVSITSFAQALQADLAARSRYGAAPNPAMQQSVCLSSWRMVSTTTLGTRAADALQGGRHALDHGLAAAAEHLTILGEQTAQLVDLHRAHLHQLLSHAVQRQYSLLQPGLDRHVPAAMLLDGLPDCACIDRVALVGRDELLDLLASSRSQCCAP